jgi:hypothetical protein
LEAFDDGSSARAFAVVTTASGTYTTNRQNLRVFWEGKKGIDRSKVEP